MLNILQCKGQLPTVKNHLAQKVNIAKVEKRCPSGMYHSNSVLVKRQASKIPGFESRVLHLLAI